MGQPRKPGSHHRELQPIYESQGRRYDPFETLAAAVIRQAVEDYVTTLRGLRTIKGDKPKDREKLTALKCSKRDLESFFRSARYDLLTDLDADLLMERCKIQAMKAPAKKHEFRPARY